MVKVGYMKDVKLREWYWETVSGIMNKKKNPVPRTCLENLWAERLTDREILYDIIFEEPAVLFLKYEWIKKYADRRKGSACAVENEIISQYIHGDMLSKEDRFALMEKMNVRVCPYCNQQYVYAVRFDDDKDGRYLGDLDHVMPKKAFPLFALSLWNLVPACKSCNQLFKRNQKKEILSPIASGFGSDCVFRIEYHSVGAIQGASLDFDAEWKISSAAESSKKQKIENNMDVFKLNELYKGHKREIQLILWKKAVCSNKAYQESLKSMVKSIRGGSLEMEHFLYGMDLSERKFGEQPHAKMVHDIVKYN